MKYYYKLNNIIDKIPTITEGEYNGFSIILLGGSSYKPKHFNKWKVSKNDKFYRKFNYEVEYPNINFQKRLSKITTTFSFDRPTDLLNHNLYNGDNYDFYIASKRDLSIKNYANFIKKLLKYYKIKPPYVLIGFSEGCWDIMSFIKYYPKYIKRVFWIDGGLVGKTFEEYEKYRGNHKWFKNTINDKFWKFSGEVNLQNKELLEKIDYYNFHIKTYTFLRNYDTLLKINKEIPIIICWAENHWKGKKDIAKPKEIIKIKNDYCKLLQKKYKLNVNCYWFNAPHQIERVLPITLSKFIINNIFSS